MTVLASNLAIRVRRDRRQAGDDGGGHQAGERAIPRFPPVALPVDNDPEGPHFRAGGPMAEWLRRGLQILARRFDSGSGLHPIRSKSGRRRIERRHDPSPSRTGRAFGNQAPGFGHSPSASTLTPAAAAEQALP